MRKFIYIFLILLTGSFTDSHAQLTLGGVSIDTHTVAKGLDIPWEMQWGPDQFIWLTERYGIVSRINPETGSKQTILNISNLVYQENESGLLGMALHPSFPSDNRVYLVYTYLSGTQIKERLVYYRYENNELTSPQILIDNIQGYNYHDGSRLVFGPDQKLYMSTGDAQNQPLSQDRNSLNGKILRINPDGSVPIDNPFGILVWSTGHRNPQGLCFKADTLLSSEHGPNTDDEINRIIPGGNYGWEPVHGYCDLPAEQVFCNDSNVIEPIHAWTPTIATSDITWYSHNAFPALQNKMLLTTLKEQDLRVLSFSTDLDQLTQEDIHFDSLWGRLRDVLVAPDGRIFLATNGYSWSESGTFRHRIIEIRNPTVHGIKHAYSSNSTLRFFHNPSIGAPKIDTEQFSANDLFAIYNNTGTLVAKGKAALINKEQLDSGIYIVNISTSTGKYTGKLIIL